MMPAALKRLFGFEDRFAKRAALRRYRPRVEGLEDRAVPAVSIVTPANLAGWALTASDGDPAPPAPSAQFVFGPDTPPAGDGSIELAVSAAGSDAAQARNASYGGTLLSDLTALSYSTYVQQNNGGLSGSLVQSQKRSFPVLPGRE